MADAQLSNGIIQDILLGHNPPRPILQVLNMKKIQSDQTAAERYRLQMSDGTYYQPCMLATQMNDKVHSKELDKFCVVQVERYICNTIHERKIIIIIQLNVLKLGPDVGGPIGQPKALELVRVDPNAQPSSTPGVGGPPPTGNRSGGPPQQGGYSGGGYGGGRGGGGYSGSGGGGMGWQNPAQNGYKPGNPPNANMSGPPRSYANAVPPARPGFDAYSSQRTTFPINSLSPYQNKWTIRARVASKPSVRTWSNSRGEGRVLSVDLLDESGEIRASCFNETADKFAAIFESGKVYYISRGRLKPANKQYTGSIKNDYELNLTDDTEVELCTDAVGSLPTIQYRFTSIADIEGVEVNSFIDVIGVCKHAGDIATIITKTSRKVSKRDLQLVDRSGRVVVCTLWGAEAEGFDGSNHPVVAMKGCKVSDFGGRSLTTQFSTQMAIDPDISEAHQLRGWFDNVGKNEQMASISEQRMGGGGQPTAFLTLGQVKELDLGRKEKPDYLSCKAGITFIKKDNCLYKACPNPDCNKKVTEGGAGGQYFCEKCNQNFPNFKFRMILSMNVADHSGSQWLTCFQDTGMEILGKSAEELGELRDQDEASYDWVFQQTYFKEYIFKLRAKMDTFNDEQRLKCYAVSVSPVNYVQETRRRIEEIKQMMAQ